MGGSAQQIIAIETAKRLGYYTVLCDFLTDNPGQHYADRFYLVSTTDKEKVLDVAQKEQISGVLAYASDPAAPTAAYVAEQMGLPGNPYDAVCTLCNKDRFRQFLSENGFHTPRAERFQSVDEALDGAKGLDLPVIVKPVDSSGSKGVTVLRSFDKLNTAAEFALRFSRCKTAIVEEFIEKKHPYLIGGDIFVYEGQVLVWGLLNCHRDPKVNPLVPVGKSYPLALDSQDAKAVRQTLQTLIDKLQIRSACMNLELIIDSQDRVFPIDIGPRAGGNMIPDLLSMIFGVDLVEMSVKAAMGQPVTEKIVRGEDHSYYATYNLHSVKDGIYKGLSISEEIESFVIEKHIYMQEGDSVEFFSDASKAIGIIFLRFDSLRSLHTMLSCIDDHIQVIVE